MAFHRLVGELSAFRSAAGLGPPGGSVAVVSFWWAIFAFLTVRWAHPGEITPDPLAGLFVVLAAIALLRLARGVNSVRIGVVLGAFVVVGWLASPPLIILLVATLVAVAAVSIRRRAWRPVVGFCVIVAFVAVPYAVALSVALGHPTVGETARYVQAWEVNGLTREYWWAGQVKGFGEPAHPPPMLASQPLTLGFAGDPRADGAPPFESTWWNAGLSAPFRPSAHFDALRESVRRYAELVPGPFLSGEIALCLLVAVLGVRVRSFTRALRRSALVVLPMLLVPVTLLFVDTEQRMVAMPLAVGSVAMLSAVSVGGRGREWARWLWVPVALLFFFAAKQPLADLNSSLRGQAIGSDQVAVVRQLEAGGVHSGDGVAAIDRVNAGGYVALGGYRVVGIVVSRGAWLASDATRQADALGALRAAGARAVVSERGAGFGPSWIAVPGSDFVVRFLEPG